MMRLWLLRPKTGFEEVGPWDPWYDKAFGHVVRAETEMEARRSVGFKCGEEGPDVWLDRGLVACTELTEAGRPEVIITDFRAA